ncbi:MAG: APC family permease [Terriglobia bacterium]
MPLELTTATSPLRLRRVLTIWDLVFYGIVLIQPIAPVGIFGIAQKLSYGHVSTAVLVAMAAMMLTAFSYGRMAAIYPSAGSAYTYVSRGLNPHVGSLIGWAMVLDYLVIPIVNVIYPALTFKRLFPAIPYAAWVGLVVSIIIFLNLLGIRFTARANEALLAIVSIVVVAFFFTAIRFLFHLHGLGGLMSLQPFYNPSTFNFGALRTATSLAALTYIGFDGVTTLAEEVENPKRTVPAATVLVCFICGILSTLEVYLGTLVWPDYHTFPNLETAFIDVCMRVGGMALFQAMAVILIIACLGTGLAGVAGAARLLYGMGRDNVLPRRFFARLDSKYNVPAFNVMVIGVLALVGALAISYERAAELLNFGAFLAFMGVNLTCIQQFCLRPQVGRRRKLLTDLLVPGLGFVFCFGIWWSLPRPAKWAGGIWFVAGFVYAAIRTRGFRREPPKMDFADL